MRIQDTKNYGKPLTDVLSSLSPELLEEIKTVSQKVMLDNLGEKGMEQFASLLPEEREKLLKHDFVTVKEHGITHPTFLRERIEVAAAYSALIRVVGEEKALAINMEKTKKVGYKVLVGFFPTVEELKACGDPFEAFKEFQKANNAANNKVGLHCIDEIEDKPDVYRFNVKFCSFYSIPQEVGLGAVCVPSCYGDDVFFAEYCPQFGVEFIRKGTIARGDKVCDFCFKRK